LRRWFVYEIKVRLRNPECIRAVSCRTHNLGEKGVVDRLGESLIFNLRSHRVSVAHRWLMMGLQAIQALNVFILVHR
jgi:hypothetical protein